jgi:hypothetical protein
MPHEIDLAFTTENVARARLRVARQRVRIIKLRDAGCSTLDAELTLDAFISTLGLLEDHERHLRDLSRHGPP